MGVQSRTVILSFYGRHQQEDVITHSDNFAAIISELDRITAVCEVDNHNSFLFPVRGPSRYFGGEESLVRHVHEVMNSLIPDVSCAIGVGDSRFIARLACVHSRNTKAPVVVFSEDTHVLLRSLSVQTLLEHTDISPDVVGVFQHLGLHTLGHVVDLGETALIDRFSVAGQHVFAIATGKDVDFFVPSEGHPPVVVICDFDSMSHHALSDAMNDSSIVVSMAQESITRFVQQVSVYGLQCLRLRISYETDHGEHNERIWCDTRGFTEHSISERFGWQLHQWLRNGNNDDHPTSYITSAVFEALECRDISVDAVTLWDVRSDSTERVVRALARVMVADEHARITVPVWRGGRDVSIYDAVDVSQCDLHDDNSRAVSKSVDWNGGVPSPRPVMLCSSPVTVTLCDSSTHNIVVTGRHELSADPQYVCFSDGTSWNVVAWAGPWPVEERWWDPQRWRRHARLQVLASNGKETVAWLLSVESRQWKIMAVYH
jgi:protein ImuB